MKRILKSSLLLLLTSSLFIGTVFATPIEEDLDNAKQKLENAQEEMEALMININAAERELVSIGQQIIEAEENLAEAEVLREEQYETMKARIVAMYENDTSSMISMLFESGNIVEFLKKAEFVQAVHDYDRAELDAYIANIEKIENLKDSLEEDMAAVEAKQSRYEEDKHELDDMIDDLESEIHDINAEIQEAARKAAEEAANREEEQSNNSGNSGNSGNANGSSYVPPAGSGGGSAVVNAAYAYLGVPYVWGGESSSGVDCSGLVKLAHKAIGVNLAHYSGSIGSGGRGVSESEALPGDVVCYVGHVGIYVGNGYMIHAPQTGDVVRVVKVYGSPWYRRYW